VLGDERGDPHLDRGGVRHVEDDDGWRRPVSRASLPVTSKRSMPFLLRSR
jgi:hypothetical protein